jgi:endonuclease YncB( thermonuclease family)
MKTAITIFSIIVILLLIRFAIRRWLGNFPFKVIIFILILPVVAAIGQKQSQGFVQRVIDGDTYIINADSYKGKPQTITVRLVNVDCPELYFVAKKTPEQPYAQEAKDNVKRLIENKIVTLNYYGKDRFGRILAFVSINNERLDDIILMNGWGWSYNKYHSPNEIKRAKKLAEKARLEKNGLWKNEYAVEPSEWRKGNH